ncbi:histidine kinase [Paraglaciecola aquimarina]|uniref:Histidine kinase n=1 Tax=Paraglaciecola algarum TaxID=3050085 RepID=A0ABS9D6X0_9ALTE|nr:histidine kinase [Paraglaciecola sp. G1-23]MCF2947783.1 histidine kinase [Paraglaciecola sp. G1-23]
MKNTATEFIANKSKPSFWWFHTLGWTVYVLIFTIDNVFFYRDYNKLGLDVLYPLLLSGFFAASLTLPLRYVYQKCWNLEPLKLIVVITFGSLLVSMIWTPLKALSMWYFYEKFDVLAFFMGQVPETFKWYTLFMSISYACFMILVWSSLYFGINYHYRLVSEKQQHIEAVKLSHISQIKMLRYQINPHFLFNTLNAVSTLVLRGSKEKANGMLIRLSTFLRFSLDNEPDKKIRLYEELKALMLYLEIEKMRFDDRLTVQFEVEPEAENLLVPSLLLQPLVENSIKYAIAQMSEGGLIQIKAKCIEGYLHIEVNDNGPNNKIEYKEDFKETRQTASSHTGVGVKNIINRLSVLYPNNHKFDVTKSEQGYFVTIVLPRERA